MLWPRRDVQVSCSRGCYDDCVNDVVSVLEFWFGPDYRSGVVPPAYRQRWFEKNAAFDAEIKERFEGTYRAIVSDEREEWLGTAEGSLAYVIVLDQFSRNMFRETAAMYDADARAVSAADTAIDNGYDAALAAWLRMFFYMPFMHAEDIRAQDRCVALFEALCRDEGADVFDDSLRYARLHRDIVAKFGRFPHRNELLGREMTAAEQQFLDEGGPRF